MTVTTTILMTATETPKARTGFTEAHKGSQRTHRGPHESRLTWPTKCLVNRWAGRDNQGGLHENVRGTFTAPRPTAPRLRDSSQAARQLSGCATAPKPHDDMATTTCRAELRDGDDEAKNELRIHCLNKMFAPGRSAQITSSGLALPQSNVVDMSCLAPS